MVGRLITSAVFVVAVAACAESPVASTELAQIPDSPLASVSVTQVHNDVGPFLVSNPCIPEQVLVSGKVHQTVKTFDDGTLQIRTNFGDLKGVGQTTGSAYVVQQNNEIQVIDPPPGSVANTAEVHTRVISKGKAPNFHIVFLRTFSAPPVNVSTTVLRSECRG